MQTIVEEIVHLMLERVVNMEEFKVNLTGLDGEMVTSFFPCPVSKLGTGWN